MEELNNQSRRSEEQEQQYEEALKKASAIEVMSKTDGWKYIVSFYEDQIRNFANRILSQKDTPISDFEGARNQIIGMKMIVQLVSDDLKLIKDERERQRNTKSTE